MNAVVEMKPGGALAATQSSGRMQLAEIIQHIALVQEVMHTVMKPDVHYGVIPGTDKPTLYKNGAEVLCMVFRIAQSYEVTDMSTPDTVRYRSVCTGSHQLSGVVLGAGMGEASSGEEKYKWRKAYKEEFDATPVHMRREKSGYDKRRKERYSIMQVRTEPADLANTILKMANKRAMLAMVLNVTAASDCFTQDLEDMDEKLREHLSRRDGAAAENDDAQPNAKPVQQQAKQTFYPQADFDANLAIWKKAVTKGQKPDDVIAKVNSANPTMPLSDEQKAAIRALGGKPADPPAMTFATVADLLARAENIDALNDAAGLIASITDEAQRKELDAKYEARSAELQAE
jgi:hypothetical protein